MSIYALIPFPIVKLCNSSPNLLVRLKKFLESDIIYLLIFCCGMINIAQLKVGSKKMTQLSLRSDELEYNGIKYEVCAYFR